MRFRLLLKPDCRKHFRKLLMTKARSLINSQMEVLSVMNSRHTSSDMFLSIEEFALKWKEVGRFFESVESETIGLFFVQDNYYLLAWKWSRPDLWLSTSSSFTSSSSSSSSSLSLSTRQCLTNRKNCFLLFLLGNQKLSEVVEAETNFGHGKTLFSILTDQDNAKT